MKLEIQERGVLHDPLRSTNCNALPVNKRTLNLALIVVLLAVWGAILRSVLLARKPEDSKPVVQLETQQDEALMAAPYELMGQYRDPFSPIGTRPVSSSSSQAYSLERSRSQSTQPKRVEAKAWPKVDYFGMVRNERSSHRTALLAIDGLPITMEVGDMHSEVLLKAVLDSVAVVHFGREEMRIYVQP